MLRLSTLNKMAAFRGNLRSFSLKDLIATLEKQEKAQADSVKGSAAATPFKFSDPSKTRTTPTASSFAFTDKTARGTTAEQKNSGSSLGVSVRESFRHASNYKSMNTGGVASRAGVGAGAPHRQNNSWASGMSSQRASTSPGSGSGASGDSNRSGSSGTQNRRGGHGGDHSMRPLRQTSSIGSSVDFDDDNGDGLSGADRYERHQRNLQIKRQGFFQHVPDNEQRVRYSRHNDSGSGMAQQDGRYSRGSSSGMYDRGRGGGRFGGDRKHLEQDLSDTKKTPVKRTAPVVQVKTVRLPSHGFITVAALASQLGVKKTAVESVLKSLGELPDNYCTDDSEFFSADESGLSASNELNSAGQTNKVDVDVAELAILEMNRVDVNVVREKGSGGMKRDILSTKKYYSGVVAGGATAENSDSSSQSAKVMNLVPRAAIVSIMGHVDHGKTTLLDSLRSGDTAHGEAGGITQKLSAFTVPFSNGSVDSEGNAGHVVFVDTPGHAAFQGMRTCGASATDMVILVVALDDGIRPQTIEAAKTAVEANCKIIVALNKKDKIPDQKDRQAMTKKILSQLVELEIVAEEYGGTVPVVELSAKTRDGVDELVEIIQLQSQVMELQAAESGLAETTILDARMEKGRGIIADVLVRWGSINIGDNFVAGESYGRIKAMEDCNGRRITSAGPSTPVLVTGFRSIPQAGNELLSVESEDKAKQIVERRHRMSVMRKTHESAMIHRAAVAAAEKLRAELLDQKLSETGNSSLTRSEKRTLAASLAPSSVSTLPKIDLILKADGMGTLQALQFLVDQIAKKVTDIVELKTIRANVGDVTSNDIHVACSSIAAAAASVGKLANSKDPAAQGGVSVAQAPATILGFNVNLIDSNTRSALKQGDVQFVRDTVIYRLEDHIISMIQDYMPKERIETVEGTAKVLQIFNYKDKAGTVVAGSSIESGLFRTAGQERGQVFFRVKRKDDQGKLQVILDNQCNGQLKRFKDIVHEVKSGLECGFSLEKYKEFEVDDVIECVKVEYKSKPLHIDRMSSDGRGHA